MDPLLSMIDEAYGPNSAPLCVPTVSSFPNNDEGLDKQFLGTSWQDHSPDALEYATPITFFNAQGFAYFLPAYMRAAVVRPESGIGDALIDRILPPKGNLKRPSFSEWWSLLSRAQQNVVLAFLAARCNSESFEILDFISRARATHVP